MENVNLNMIPGRVLPVCHASQYDIGRQIRFNLFDGDQVFAFASGDTAEIHIRKTDNTVITAALTVAADQTYVELVTSQQMTAAAGLNVAEIEIKRTGVTLGSLNFIFDVEADPLAGGVNSASEIHDLHAQVSAEVAESMAEFVAFNPYGIPPYMTSFFKPLNNLFSEFDNHITGAYYSGMPATVGNHLAVVTTPNWQGWLVRVKPNTTYTIGPHDFRLLFYSNDLVIDKIYQQAELSTTDPNTVTSGSNSFWMAITQRITRDMTQYMIVEGSTYPATYESGLPQWVDTPKAADNAMSFAGMSWSVSPITVNYEDNHADVTLPQGRIYTPKGALITQAGQITFNSNGWLSYDLTADTWIAGSHVEGHELYCIGWVAPTLNKSMLLANYVENGQPGTTSQRLWGVMYTTTMPKIKYTATGCTITIPAARLLYSGGTISAPAASFDLTVANWLAYDVDAQEYHMGATVTGHTLIELGIITPYSFESSWINGTALAVDKTIAFFGDSLSAGSGTNKVFHEYMAERYGFTCLNYAYGGSGYVRSYQSYGAGLLGIGEPGRGVPITADNYFIPNNVLTRLAEVNPADVDAVVIFAGTNDWGNGVPFADFVAGVDAVFDYYQNNFGTVPLLVMTPVHRVNDTVPNVHTGKTLADYVDAIIQECRKYGVPYIDTMSASGLHPDNAGNNSAFFPRDDRGDHASDGLHPNHIAHERLQRAIGETLNGLVKYDNRAMR